LSILISKSYNLIGVFLCVVLQYILREVLDKRAEHNSSLQILIRKKERKKGIQRTLESVRVTAKIARNSIRHKTTVPPD
jgi:hypothetical protein